MTGKLYRCDGVGPDGLILIEVDDVDQVMEENERLKKENAELKMQLGANIAYHQGIDDGPSISRSIK